MMSRVLPFVVFTGATLMALLGGGLFAVAGASFGDGNCRDYTSAEWEMMNGNCSDAADVMRITGPFAALGLLGMGLSFRGMRRA